MQMLTLAKNVANSFLNRVGLEVGRYRPEYDSQHRLVRSLNHFHINSVIDIGANQGQFAKGLRMLGYSGKIISFEPLLEAHSLLIQNARKDRNWTVFERCALGSENGVAKINIAGNSVSSSVLSMAPVHSQVLASSSYVATDQVPIFRLDDVLPKESMESDQLFLKLDTQGYESQVLKGATRTLQLARGLVVETSLTELYVGETLWLPMIHLLEELGFHVWSIDPGFTDNRIGRTLQCDFTFFRN